MATSCKVTVIVPVHNAGPALERSIGSVLAQTMAPEDFEAIFVDDGSTDGSGTRLDEIAAAHAHIRVLHIDASGSPGRPRNLAIAEARGEYIQFLDADDRLSDDALEALYAMAVRNGSDIVIGKLVSDFRNVSWDLFRRSYEACTLADAPLIGNLTVSKMFRTAFLNEHDLRFPEGWPKIEDEYLVVRAYLAARVVSVLSDRPVYFYCRRQDGGNLSAQPLDAPMYYAHLRAILTRITDAIGPGQVRARLLRRFYRIEMLGRFDDDAYLDGEEAYRRQVFDAMRALAVEVIDDEVHDGLAAVLRLRSGLLRQGRRDALLDLVRRERGISFCAIAGPLEAVGGRLRVPFRAELRWADGSPLVLERDGQRLLLDRRLTDGITDAPVDVTVDAQGLRIHAAAHERDGSVEWMLPVAASVTLEPVGDSGRLTPVALGTVALDPGAVGPRGRSLDAATWDVAVRFRGFDLDLRTAVRAGPRPPLPVSPILVSPAGLAKAEDIPGETLAIVVRRGETFVGEWLRAGGARLVRDGDTVSIFTPAACAPRTLGGARLVLGAEHGLEGEPGKARWGGSVFDLMAARAAGSGIGRRPLSLRFGDGPLIPLGDVVQDGPSISVQGLARLGVSDRLDLEVTRLRLATRRAALRTIRSIRRRTRRKN